VNVSSVIARLVSNTSLPKLDRTLALLRELRSGRYHAASNLRTYLVGVYKDLVISLHPEDYAKLKQLILLDIPKLIEERESQKIAYSLLSNIIAYSCVGDTEIYKTYEFAILNLAKTNKDKYFYHVITLACTKNKVLGDISDIEDFFIEKYLQPSRTKTINYQHLTDFSINVPAANKRKLLAHLFKCKPFRDDKQFINRYIASHDELKKYAVLI
jgi:hypothetical protein